MSCDSRLLLLIAAVGALASCKGTEDYLHDLSDQRALLKGGQLRQGTYDAGQLVHEAYAGLIEAEELTSRDVARSVSYSGYVVLHNEVPLLRANALAYLAHVTRRFPLPPANHRLEVVSEEEATAILDDIDAAQAPLAPARFIIEAASPDRTVSLRALRYLRELTGEDLGDDFLDWQAWWEEELPRLEREVDEAARGPLERLVRSVLPGRTARERLANASGFLQIIARGDFYRPALRDLRLAVVRNLGRQVVVNAVTVALDESRRPRPVSPADNAGRFALQHSELDLIQGAESARLIRDPSFEGPLLRALDWATVRQSSAPVLSALLGALEHYPSGELVQLCIENLASPHPSVERAAQRTLRGLTAASFSGRLNEWRDWWTRTGKARWKDRR